MNFGWKDFLLLAAEWADNATGTNYPEALYRSVISRAYYAAYHTAHVFAQDLGMQPTSSASDH